jgi:site-specific DNA-methyltransferase (adenine-specific)
MLELNKLYNIDCLDGMQNISDKSIDCIVTSPPYNLGGDFHTFVNGKRVTYGDYNTYKDKLTEKDYQSWQVDILKGCYRILKDDGVMFYNHKNRIVEGSVVSPFEWLSKTEFNIYQVIVLNLKSTANVDKRRFFPVHELLFVLTKSNKTKLNNIECLTDVWEMKKVPRKESGHPATFHIDLPSRCILSATKEGDLIFDPFVGTGTTAIACINANRSYIGFELDTGYFNLANGRIVKHKEGE